MRRDTEGRRRMRAQLVNYIHEKYGEKVNSYNTNLMSESLRGSSASDPLDRNIAIEVLQEEREEENTAPHKLLFERVIGKMGRNYALESGSTRTNDEDLALLEARAHVLAEPLAELGELPAGPSNPRALAGFGALLLGMLMVPIIYYLNHAGEQKHLIWPVTIIGGSTVGFVIAWCLVYTVEATITHRVMHWVGLTSGIVVGVAAFLAGVVKFDNNPNLIFMVGLAALELIVVILMEWLGRRYRLLCTRYEIREEEFGHRLAAILSEAEKIDSWTVKRARYEQMLNEQRDTELTEHQIQESDREEGKRFASFACRSSKLHQDACKAAQEGYFMGIAENQLQTQRVENTQIA